MKQLATGSFSGCALAISLLIGLSIGLGIPAQSAENAATTPSAPATLDGQLLVKRLKALRPDIPIEGVVPSPIPGIFQLNLPDGSAYYGTGDGRYLFAGDLFELGDKDLINLAETTRSARRSELIGEVATSDMVVFPSDGKRKAFINVFTDVDCGYCRKLHLEVPELNAMGVEVRYLAYPRAGLGSDAYQKIVSAWCSDDRNVALTDLKLGKKIPDAACINPVADQYSLGQRVGISGTPAIILQDGRLLPGYMPAKELAQTIGI